MTTKASIIEAFTENLKKPRSKQAKNTGIQSILQGLNYRTTEDYFREVVVEHLFDELFPHSGLDVKMEHHVPSTEILKLFNLPSNWTPHYMTTWLYWNFRFTQETFKLKVEGFQLKRGCLKLPTMH